MKKLCLVILAMLAFPPSVSAARSPCVDEQRVIQAASEKCFTFYTACREIGLKLYVDPRLFRRQLNDAIDHPIKRKAEAALESRLRSARIYGPDVRQPILNVRINVFRNNRGGAISMSFWKSVFDPLSRVRRMRVTWMKYEGVRRTDEILPRLSELTDEFLLEFLRVNEKACARRDKRTP